MQTQRNAVRAMYTGAALTVIAALVLIADQATGDLARHLKAAYPSNDAQWLDMTMASIATYLYVVYGVGVVLWLWLARAGRKGGRRARLNATVVFLVGTALLAFNFTQPHPMVVTVAGVLPCLAGLAAVAFLWKRSERV
ncbi:MULTISPECIES: hypothetical protein [Nonomuraea]|uniref:DUF2637 domain-containing protein n=1 Tax=Nonomuraea mangrovi TaxID=2316207 RepID=A0ABW4T273_9ACTN